MRPDKIKAITKIQSMFTEIFGLGKAAALTAILAITVVLALAVYSFIHLAPPHTLTITSGPEGSIFRNNAEKYAKILARNGIKLKILTSQGSLENLRRLADPKLKVDVGFVQGGLAGGSDIDKLVSLGSLYNEPLLIFYRSSKELELLSQMKGRRLAIGPEGSGTRPLVLTLLAANGIQPGGTTTLLDLDADDAANALLGGKVDAVFLMGDSASIDIIRKLVRAPGIRLLNVVQADGYTRRITYLSKMLLPEGALDFGNNLPGRDVNLIGPTVELIAREDLHPALSDLLLEAAREIHGRAGLFRRQDEFPAPIQHEFTISANARSFYRSGKGFLYRYLPFWVASFLNRVLVVFLPSIVVLIPVLRAIPAAYRWKIRLGIYRWYRSLMALEREMAGQFPPEKREEFLERLDHIERAANRMKIPASFADRFYDLRGHITLVRNRLLSTQSR
jgi:hypothetical protein